MRKAAFVSLSLGFATSWLLVLAAACGSSTSHPGAIPGVDDGGPLVDRLAPPVDTGIPDGAPTTVQISGGDGGSISQILFGDQGFVNCGAAATSAPVTILNTGPAPLNWTATLSAGAKNYSLSPVSGSVQPGQSATLQVIPNAIPQTSDVTPDLYGGVVTIQTSASNDTTHVVQLHQTARGVILKSTLAATFDFHSQAVSIVAKAPFSLTNTGNVAATVRLVMGSPDFTVLAPDGTTTMPFVIGANGAEAPALTFKPTAVQNYTGTLVTNVDPPAGGTSAALCGPLPVNVTVQGSGNNTVQISPTNVDFGATNCGATATPSQVTLTNIGAPISFTTAFAKGTTSPFAVSPATGNISSSGSQIFTITPVAVPSRASTLANAFGDSLSITTNDGITGPTIHAVTLTQTARGAVFAFAPLTISTLGLAGQSQFAQFSVTNTGNTVGSFTLGGGTPSTAVTQDSTDGGAATWSSNLSSGSLNGNGASLPGNLTVTNPAKGAQNLGHITLTSNTVLCADPPPNLQLSATGN